MKDTYFIVPPAEAARVAVVYRDNRNDRSTFCRWDPTWKVTMTMPDGGLFSYPREIMKFLQLFLDDEGRVLAHDTVRAMRTQEAPGWGLGWAVVAVDGSAVVLTPRLSLEIDVPAPGVSTPLSRVTSGVMRNEITWLRLPVTLI